MVLSLTTEPDGNERRYAGIVAEALGVPALDVKVVPADENRFGSGHGFNTSPSDGTPAAIAGATEKIRAKAQLLASAALETPPDGLSWADGAFVGGGRSQTIADLALYAHGSGALPPGIEGGLDAQTVYRD
jgi:carbon-monoxide dehydrogenase large subunit